MVTSYRQHVPWPALRVLLFPLNIWLFEALCGFVLLRVWNTRAWYYEGGDAYLDGTIKLGYAKHWWLLGAAAGPLRSAPSGPPHRAPRPTPGCLSPRGRLSAQRPPTRWFSPPPRPPWSAASPPLCGPPWRRTCPCAWGGRGPVGSAAPLPRPSQHSVEGWKRGSERHSAPSPVLLTPPRHPPQPAPGCRRRAGSGPWRDPCIGAPRRRRARAAVGEVHRAGEGGVGRHAFLPAPLRRPSPPHGTAAAAQCFERITHTHAHEESAVGGGVSYRTLWSPMRQPDLRAAVVIVHGYGAHGGVWAPIAQRLALSRCAVCTLDLQGKLPCPVPRGGIRRGGAKQGVGRGGVLS